MATGISAIGPIMQIAFVPDDFDAALAHWTGVMGVGPFFLFENMQLADSRFRGAPNECVFSIALAYWGDLQIELIRQENNAPSIYRDAKGPGLHHTCVLTADLAAARATAEAQGGTVLVEGSVAPDGGVIYVDMGAGSGSIVEILQPASGMKDLFAMMRGAAREWDGTDPVRRLG
jgi:hypothetical protein